MVKKLVLLLVFVLAPLAPQAADYSTADLCRAIGESPNIAVSPRDRLFLEKNCSCIGGFHCVPKGSREEKVNLCIEGFPIEDWRTVVMDDERSALISECVRTASHRKTLAAVKARLARDAKEEAEREREAAEKQAKFEALRACAQTAAEHRKPGSRIDSSDIDRLCTENANSPAGAIAALDTEAGVLAEHEKQEAAYASRRWGYEEQQTYISGCEKTVFRDDPYVGTVDAVETYCQCMLEGLIEKYPSASEIQSSVQNSGQDAFRKSTASLRAECSAFGWLVHPR